MKAQEIRLGPLPKECFFLDRAYFPFPWTELQWSQQLKNESTYLFYEINAEGIVHSFILGDCALESRVFWIHKVLTHPESRSKGLASGLVELIELSLDVKDFYLEVAESNSLAIGFYEKLGFQAYDISKSFYSNGEAAFKMRRCGAQRA